MIILLILIVLFIILVFTCFALQRCEDDAPTIFFGVAITLFGVFILYAPSLTKVYSQEDHKSYRLLHLAIYALLILIILYYMFHCWNNCQSR